MRHTAETKRKLSAMRKGEMNPFFGKTHTAAFKKAQSERTKAFNAKRQYDLNPVSIKNPTQNRWAYIAGIIDGEGSICFKRGQPSVSIVNTYEPLLKWVRDEIGGRYSVTNKGSNNLVRARKPVFYWELSGVLNIYFFLAQIRPFLIIKAARADQAISALEAKYKERLRG